MGAMRRLFWVGLACLTIAACAKSRMTSGGSSETHFLSQCEASCDEGLSCVCGICTEACDEDDACEDLNGQASCEIAAGDACSTARVCDVECSDDDDCTDLSDDHTCDDGRCRAPMIASTAGAGGTSGEGGSGGSSSGAGGSGGSTSEPLPTECTTTGLSAYILGETIEPCQQVTFETLDPTRIADCVRDKRDAGQPFFVRWPEPGEDSQLERGLVGYMSRGYMMYEVYYDSLGFGDGSTRPWLAKWTRVNTLTIATECDTIAGCFAYDTFENTACGCGMEQGDEIFIECVTPPAMDECEAPSCLIDGICYPDGESSEDGCCSCEDGSYTCIEPGWCPSWPLIGKRCESDGDCMSGSESGLRCQESISGEHKICTRDCNFGCPTGTECVATEDYEGELCMRSCTTQANCNIDVFGEPLGSECAGIGEGGLYCR